MKGWTSKPKKEESIQIQVSEYIKLAYPNVIFTAESSGIRLTMGQAIKAKRQRSERGLPDLWILEARGDFHGLIIELKRDGESPFKKDGTLKKATRKNTDGTKYDHNQEQQDNILRLWQKGYCSCFCTGFDEAKDTIDSYMNL